MKWIILTLFLASILIVGCSKEPASTIDINKTIPTDTILIPEESITMASCITEKGMIMYGTEWCSHCKAQKEMFGQAFEYINYVDCDANPNECASAGIKGYPTWLYNGKLYEGGQTWQQLEDLTGCIKQPLIGNEDKKQEGELI